MQDGARERRPPPMIEEGRPGIAGTAPLGADFIAGREYPREVSLCSRGAYCFSLVSHRTVIAGTATRTAVVSLCSRGAYAARRRRGLVVRGFLISHRRVIASMAMRLSSG